MRSIDQIFANRQTEEVSALSNQLAFERCLAQERRFLFRLARSQLRDDQAAEDAVQETAIAAWQGLDQFQARSSIRTWLVGILRFKILDALRQRQRQPVALDAVDIDRELQQTVSEELVFNEQGQWAEMPQAWNEPVSSVDALDQTLHQQQLMQMLEHCLSVLPGNTAHVFLMREYMGFNCEEIAQRTSLKAGHVRVILSRVRLTLRTCIDVRRRHSNGESSDA